MWDQFAQIATFVFESFLNIWPYLLLSIPLAVTVRVTNASRYIQQAFDHRPLIAIGLATLVGAFSPLCSCTVIPLITSLLIAGVPFGAVMAFWIASPTMDPEIFLLSAGVLGWELAIVRVAATLALSLGAGLVAHTMQKKQVFKDGILRDKRQSVDWSWKRLFSAASGWINPARVTDTRALANAEACCTTPEADNFIAPGTIDVDSIETSTSSCATNTCAASAAKVSRIDWGTVRRESLDATWMVAKFMIIAFALEAVIQLYVPQSAIVALLGVGNPLAVGLAALVGIPIYTTNIAAIPLVGGLLEGGMMPGAALAFLIAGPATTIPAMSAVYGIAKPRVFAVYVAITLVGAVVISYAYQLFSIL